MQTGSDNPAVQAISRKDQRRMFRLDQIPDAIGYYFAGFVDGEGSFHISFRQRPDYKLPWKVTLGLNVSQKDRVILALFKRHIQCGSIRYKGGDVWMFEVNNLNAIRTQVIPFFEKFGFLSAKKQRDFAIFKRMAELMASGAHLSKEGIAELLKLRTNMNDGGKRKWTDDMILSAFETVKSSETICRTSIDLPVQEPAIEDDIVRPAGRPVEPGRNVQAGEESESNPGQ